MLTGRVFNLAVEPRGAQVSLEERDVGLTRRKLVKHAAAAAAGIVTGDWLLRQPQVQEVYDLVFGAGYLPPARSWLAPGYLHGCFSVTTPEAVAKAASLGINFAINYSSATVQSVNPGAPLGQAMQQYGMKTILNIEAFDLTCSGGVGHANLEGIRELVSTFRHSPLLGGYWIKDDDCGAMRAAVTQIARTIRSLDPDPSHLIVPGFDSLGSVARGYEHGQGDALGFYLYPGDGNSPFTKLVPMLDIVRQRTPRGAQPPPIIGIYQAYGNPPRKPTPTARQLLAYADAFLAHGAIGLCAFAWFADGASETPDNDPGLRDGIALVSDRLRQRHG